MVGIISQMQNALVVLSDGGASVSPGVLTTMPEPHALHLASGCLGLVIVGGWGGQGASQSRTP